jgi:L-rhamnose isomerase
MKYTVVKWMGTILIVAAGIYAAYNMTYTWKIKELKLFKLTLPESTYQISDNQKIKTVIGLAFKSKDEAKAVSKDRDALRAALKKAFQEVGAESLSNADSINELRTKLILELQNEGFAVEQLSFDTHPVLL